MYQTRSYCKYRGLETTCQVLIVAQTWAVSAPSGCFGNFDLQTLASRTWHFWLKLYSWIFQNMRYWNVRILKISKIHRFYYCQISWWERRILFGAWEMNLIRACNNDLAHQFFAFLDLWVFQTFSSFHIIVFYSLGTCKKHIGYSFSYHSTSCYWLNSCLPFVGNQTTPVFRLHAEFGGEIGLFWQLKCSAGFTRILLHNVKVSQNNH